MSSLGWDSFEFLADIGQAWVYLTLKRPAEGWQELASHYVVRTQKNWLPWYSVVKNPPAMQEIWVWSLGWEHGNPFQYSCLENSMHRGAGGLQSVGSQRVGHDWATEHSTQHTERSSSYLSVKDWGVPGCACLSSCPSVSWDREQRKPVWGLPRWGGR